MKDILITIAVVLGFWWVYVVFATAQSLQPAVGLVQSSQVTLQGSNVQLQQTINGSELQ